MHVPSAGKSSDGSRSPWQVGRTSSPLPVDGIASSGPVWRSWSAGIQEASYLGHHQRRREAALHRTHSQTGAESIYSIAGLFAVSATGLRRLLWRCYLHPAINHPGTHHTTSTTFAASWEDTHTISLSVFLIDGTQASSSWQSKRTRLTRSPCKAPDHGISDIRYTRTGGH